MGARLYVGNLGEDASTEALRRRFALHGNVADVHMAIDRSSGRSRGYAFVTMGSSAEARTAIRQLNGASFDDRPLRVTEAGTPQPEPVPERKPTHGRSERNPVHITSQFRERHNMTYEIDSRGVTLAIRVFPGERVEDPWRVEARAKGPAGQPDTVVAAESTTRAAALEDIARTWPPPPANDIDWAGVHDALAAVRAL
jgi:RNA recognition motif-containing protein